MQYTSRGMRRRRNTDKWEITLSHKDPITGEQVRSFHTIEAKTEKQAERKRNELMLELERKGAAAGSKMTVREFMSMFLDYKEKAAIVEASTIRGYRHESKLVCRYIGELRLGDVGIPDVNGFMASMTADGYAPKSVQGAFRLLKQAFKWAQAQKVVNTPAEADVVFSDESPARLNLRDDQKLIRSCDTARILELLNASK